MKTYRVAQWATGAAGAASLKGIIRHPRLELAAVRVYSDEKNGKDAGELVDLPATGVVASNDSQAVFDAKPDCVIYSPMPWNVDEMCGLLAAGIHVITPCPYWFPWTQDPDAAAAIESACRKGGVNFHASGCNPGGVAERFPITFTGWCNRIDRIRMTEYGDCREYTAEGVIRELMNIGKTPQQVEDNPMKEMLKAFWYEPIDMIAEAIGSEVVEYEQRHNFGLATEEIADTAIGIIEEGTVALNNYQHIGRTREGTEIIEEQFWFMDDLDLKRIEGDWNVPRSSGWRIHIEGDVELIVDIDVGPDLPHAEHTAMGMSTTGFHCVNAVVDLCEAPDPGIKTYLDLPMVRGCMGTFSSRPQSAG